MRKFFLLLPLLAAMGRLAQPCQAQSLDERIRNIYSPLSKTEVLSGILIHQTPLFVWPGPTNGMLHIVAASLQAGSAEFNLIDQSGRTVAGFQRDLTGPYPDLQEGLNLENLPVGIYGWRFTANGQVQTGRVIKN